MKTSNLKVIFRVTALTVAFALSGCLSGESSPDTNSVVNPPPAGNTQPTISGTPASAVVVGTQYSFAPVASDSDGDTLTFSIQNKPSWAEFDTSSGTLSGMPTLADIGPYSNVSISVSDGTASASLPQFTVDVTQVALGSATLTWTAPTQNDDGTTLTDLAGYKIFYGTSPGSYSEEILIDNPSINTYVVENLVPNTYYFAAKSFNSAEVDSNFSGEVSKLVQ